MDIIKYDESPKHRFAFRALNEQWLNEFFYIEEMDVRVLSQPEKIINEGGFIYFGHIDHEIMGTVSLFKMEAGKYEMAKLAVSPAYRGRGYGKILLQHAISEFYHLKGSELILVSSRLLKPALSLYYKLGFVEVPFSAEDPAYYQRADIKMKLQKTKAQVRSLSHQQRAG